MWLIIMSVVTQRSITLIVLHGNHNDNDNDNNNNNRRRGGDEQERKGLS